LMLNCYTLFTLLTSTTKSSVDVFGYGWTIRSKIKAGCMPGARPEYNFWGMASAVARPYSGDLGAMPNYFDHLLNSKAGPTFCMLSN